jgi:lipid-A-disaccharide synthase
VGLPNIVAGRFIVAEFLQREATADNLARAALNLYEDTVTRRKLELIFAAMAASLHANPALAAEAVVGELRLAGVAR